MTCWKQSDNSKTKYFLRRYLTESSAPFAKLGATTKVTSVQHQFVETLQAMKTEFEFRFRDLNKHNVNLYSLTLPCCQQIKLSELKVGLSTDFWGKRLQQEVIYIYIHFYPHHTKWCSLLARTPAIDLFNYEYHAYQPSSLLCQSGCYETHRCNRSTSGFSAVGVCWSCEASVVYYLTCF